MKLISSKLIILSYLVCLLIPPIYAQESPDPKVVEAARREGEIVWYTTMSLDQSKEFMDRFLKKYPFLRPSVFRSGGGALLNRVSSEAESGKIFVRRRPWHGGDCFATDGTGSSGSIQFRRTKNDP